MNVEKNQAALAKVNRGLALIVSGHLLRPPRQFEEASKA
jgi:hypothetical protein